MLPENRRTVETLFREGNLPVLVATSTLAMGVNLPAHLVIVKTTKYYVSGEYRSYSESAMLQMIGRAGRPGYDEKGYAVIMATAADKVGGDGGGWDSTRMRNVAEFQQRNAELRHLRKAMKNF